MIDALDELKQEAFFDSIKLRKEITLLVTVSDSFMSEEVEEEASRRLNSPEIHKEFKKRFSSLPLRGDV